MNRERVEQLKKELEKEAENRTELEQQLYHTISEHFAVAFDQIAVAHAELELLVDDEETDERVVALQEISREIIKMTDEKFNEVLNSIPGVPTVEEAAEIKREYLEQLAAIAKATENGGRLH